MRALWNSLVSSSHVRRCCGSKLLELTSVSSSRARLPVSLSQSLPIRHEFHLNLPRRFNLVSQSRVMAVQGDEPISEISALNMDSKEVIEGSCHEIGTTFHVPGLQLTDHFFEAPLDYSESLSGRIKLFAREVVAVANVGKNMPWLLFLQGGPGFEAPRPSEASGWLSKACESHRVVLLDQRGTGLSMPLGISSLAQFSSPEEQAAYLAHFRADNIVRDAELIRKQLLPPGEKWVVLGQSFGGFCAVSYLSFAPEGLSKVLLTGGLPPIHGGCTAEAVYRSCFARVEKQSQKFYKRFPEDAKKVRELMLYLGERQITLPSGSILSPRGLQTIGLWTLGAAGGFEKLHFLLEGAWDPQLTEGAPKNLSSTFLQMIDNSHSFVTNPLYALLHEACYCQGAPSRWAAERVREDMADSFDPIKISKNGGQVPFTGEMIFPWMFDEISALRPLKKAAHLLAEKEDWGPLYNKEVLNANKVPTAAVLYYEDLYVSPRLSEDTAAEINGARVWVTNEFMHSGIRENGGRVLDRLLGMLSGAIPLN